MALNGAIEMGDHGASGYATASAAVLSLAFALMAVALMSRAQGALRLARADYDATRLGIAFESAAAQSVAQVITAKGAGPYAFIATTDLGPFAVQAEPEWQKLSVSHSDQLTDERLKALGVGDPASLRTRLDSQKDIPLKAANPWSVEAASSSPAWRSCANSLISVFGTSPTLPVVPPAPALTAGANFRVGEIWRLVIRSPSGRTDERFVRFVGDPARPALVLDHRTFTRKEGVAPCIVAKPSV